MTLSSKEKPDTYRLVYVGRSSLEIARDFGARLSRLIREGFEVHVLCSDDGGVGALSERGVICTPIPVLNPNNLAGLLGAYFIVQAFFLEKRPVLVHAFDGAIAWVGAAAAGVADVTVIVVSVEEHQLEDGPVKSTIARLHTRLSDALDTPLEILPDPLSTRLQSRLKGLPGPRELSPYRMLSAMVDKYLVNNEYDLQMLQERGLVLPSKLEMIIGARGVDLERFDLHDDAFWTPTAARKALGLPDVWRDVLGFKGKLQSPRALADLVTCIEQVAHTHPTTGWVLDIDTSALGGRTTRRALRGLRAHERAGRVRMVGAHEAAPQGILADNAVFYRALDLFISPRYRLGSPTELMEAAAAEVGAIAYHLPTTEAAVEHGQTGELVDPGDLDGLIAAVRAGLNDPNRREAYGKRARSRALRHFNRQHVEDQVFRIYDTTLETKLMP